MMRFGHSHAWSPVGVRAMTLALLLAAWVGQQPVLAAGGGHGGVGAAAGGASHGKASDISTRQRKLTPRLPPDVREDWQKYCYNIADAARDARYARQKAQLNEMEQRLKKLLKELSRKRDEYMRWVQRRQSITARMTKSMLEVYAKMEPEIAAAQIARMEYAVAVAILTGLKPQQASAILAEMEPKQAGRLVNVIVGAVAESAPASPRRARETN